MSIRTFLFSNSITIEHNTLGGGAIGHIVRNRRVEADTAVLEDRWFHYDQVGSVLSESDADGELVAKHYQDAFGVRLEGWETALPGGAREGWAHNTKELDPGTGCWRYPSPNPILFAPEPVRGAFGFQRSGRR